MDSGLLGECRAALDQSPTKEGGTIIVLATDGQPPAMAMLSTSDVVVGANGSVLVAIHRGASAARRLDESFTLLVPADDRAIRAEVVHVSVRAAGELAVLEGRLAGLRPTAEPPWAMRMQFFQGSSGDVADHLRYWRDVHRWLTGGAATEPPELPSL